MTSPTQLTEKRREMKRTSCGRARKNALANKGSTAPNLPLDKPNANELKQKSKKPSPAKA